MTRHFILGTAGHIDHGKSTLVKVLTGSDPDRLPEEKARGMTIELGFTHFSVTDPEESSVDYSVGVVDVPGHADFVRNMVAGVSGIDVALFAVAADDGWMPQSEEHLQILSYLGISHAVIALTKADLAEDIEFSVEMLREELRGTWLAEAPIVPVAAMHARGIDELRRALAAIFRRHPGALDVGKPRLHVDRAFSPTGIGSVVTGTLIGGSLAGGTEAIVQPLGLAAHIRTVQSHRSKKDHARPGMRTALNIPDVPLATRSKKSGVARGHVITLPRLGGSHAVIDVRLEKSARAVPGQPGFSLPVRNGQHVRLHHGSASYEGRIYLLGTKSLDPGATVLAELRLRTPAHAFTGDRFVLRDWSKRFTIAGGLVLDPDARRTDFRKPRHGAFLAAAAAAPDDPATLIRAIVARDRAIARDGVLVKSRFSDAEVRKATEAVIRDKSAVPESGWLLDAEWWGEVTDRAATLVRTHHKLHPETQGLSLTQLRVDLGRSLPEPRLFDVLISHLVRHGFARSGDVLRSGQHRAVLPLALESSGQRLRAALAQNPFDPPAPAELAPTTTEQRTLKFLIENGEVIDLGERAVVSREAFERMKDHIVANLRERNQATASELREAIGTTRRIIIPLLEKLDRDGVTRRSGDYRMLRPHV